MPIDPHVMWFSCYYSASQTPSRAHLFTNFIEIYVIIGFITNWYGILGRIESESNISMNNSSFWSIMNTIYSHLLHDKMQKFQERFTWRTGLSHYKHAMNSFMFESVADVKIWLSFHPYNGQCQKSLVLKLPMVLHRRICRFDFYHPLKQNHILYTL